MAPCTKPPPVTPEQDPQPTKETSQPANRTYEIIKVNLLTFGYWHLAGLFGLYQAFTEAKWGTLIMAYIIFVLAAIGVTAGAHRLWAHRTYKAKMPLQILLIVMNTFAFQNTAISWVRDHRLHHKYSDTEADPHNASRGFFYSHMGWLLVKKSELVKAKGRTIDLTDVYSNPVLKFQKKYAIPFIGAVCFVIPTLIPVYLFEERLIVAWNITMLRYISNLHITFLVNSAAHKWGNKPYDRRILPVQSLPVAFCAFGEGFHNYHHVFPWDYRAAELGNNYLNVSTKFIDFFAWLGWAYDMKAVPEALVKSRVARSGDGTNLWGWGDKDMDEDVKKMVEGD